MPKVVPLRIRLLARIGVGFFAQARFLARLGGGFGLGLCAGLFILFARLLFRGGLAFGFFPFAPGARLRLFFCQRRRGLLPGFFLPQTRLLFGLLAFMTRGFLTLFLLRFQSFVQVGL